MIKQKILSALLALHLVLSSWKGYVALFRQDAEEPCQIFPAPVSALPPSDRQALEAGIVVRNRLQLEQLLEDFVS